MSYRVVIPSRNQNNAITCVRSIRENQPDAPIMVVIDESPEFPNMRDEMEALGADTWPGKKPFVFARNVNAGIGALFPFDSRHKSNPQLQVQEDIIILNDDTRLLTPGGFAALSKAANLQTEYGVVSAAMTGAVGNLEQLYQQPEHHPMRIRQTSHHTLVFVAVYIRAEVLNAVGLLDELYEAYGYDDDCYCARVRLAGLKLGIFDGCVIEHGELPSTYRSDMQDNVARLDDLMPNRERFIAKYGCLPQDVKQLKS